MIVRATIIIFLLGMCIHSSLQAQNVKIKLDNCKLDPATLEEIQQILNFQLTFYAELFNQPVDTSFNARIFGTEKEFVKFSKTHANFNPVRNHSIAYYDFKLNEMILHKEVSDFPRVFSHELSHAILNSYVPKTESWLDEGLAEALEDLVLMPDSSSFFIFGGNRARKVAAAQQFFFEGASISDVIYARDFYRASDSHKNYSLSFATVVYLLSTRRAVFVNILKGDVRKTYQVLAANYPEGLELLEMDVKSFFLNFRSTGLN